MQCTIIIDGRCPFFGTSSAASKFEFPRREADCEVIIIICIAVLRLSCQCLICKCITCSTTTCTNQCPIALRTSASRWGRAQRDKALGSATRSSNLNNATPIPTDSSRYIVTWLFVYCLNDWNEYSFYSWIFVLFLTTWSAIRLMALVSANY
jgi:hypothetical protein